MNIRAVLGVPAGFVTWWVLFYASTFVFAALWPAFQEAGRPAVESGDFSQLTTGMLSLLVVMYFWVNPLSGLVTVLITRNRKHAWFTAAPIFLFAAYQHFYFLWNNLPDWYNVLVPLLVPPLVFLGGMLVKTLEQR
ncbi:MAG: hypothetical protein WDZ30_12500 [Cellvibrionaceae bacterium]